MTSSSSLITLVTYIHLANLLAHEHEPLEYISWMGFMEGNRHQTRSVSITSGMYLFVTVISAIISAFIDTAIQI